jgi:hypothetical protein
MTPSWQPAARRVIACVRIEATLHRGARGRRAVAGESTLRRGRWGQRVDVDPGHPLGGSTNPRCAGKRPGAGAHYDVTGYSTAVARRFAGWSSCRCARRRTSRLRFRPRRWLARGKRDSDIDAREALKSFSLTKKERLPTLDALNRRACPPAAILSLRSGPGCVGSGRP